MALTRELPAACWPGRGVGTIGSATADRSRIHRDRRFRRADAAALFPPNRRVAREVLERRDLLRRAVRPSLERFPVFGRDDDDPPLEDIGFGRVERLATDKIAEAGMGLLRRGRARSSTSQTRTKVVMARVPVASACEGAKFKIFAHSKALYHLPVSPRFKASVAMASGSTSDRGASSNGSAP